MTAPAHPSRLRAVARLLLLVAAIGLTTWGVCLIAFAGTTRGTRLGIPVAFWGVLLGYTAIRTNGHRSTASHALADVAVAPPQVPSSASAELVRERDEVMRHEYETRLEVMLRRELEQVLRTELAGLRSDVTDLREDVADLRADVRDAVDGRLRMEHVEITRITGANLAALQDDGRISVRAAAPEVAMAGSGTGSDQAFRREDASILNGHGFDAVHNAAADGGRRDQDGSGSQPGPWRDSVRGGVLEPVTRAPSGQIAAAAAVAPPRATPVSSAPSPLSASATSAATIPPSVPVVPAAVQAPSPPTGSRPTALPPTASLPAPPAPAVSSGPALPEPVARATALPQPVPDPSPHVEAAPLTEPASEPRPSADRSGPDASPAPAASRSSDPFASLPRLSAFRLPDLPPGMSLSKPVPAPTAPEPAKPVSAAPEASAPAPAGPVSGYVGRRRQAGADAEDEAEASPGRHGTGSESTSTPTPSGGSGGSTRPVAHRR